MSDQVAIGNLSAKAASRGTLIKLVTFSVCLGVIPITSYFTSLKYVWNGNATYAAITAVVAANLVLVAYIITSLLEDSQPLLDAQSRPDETKKER